MKKNIKKFKISISTIGVVFLLVFFVLLNVLTNTYAQVLTSLMGTTGRNMTQIRYDWIDQEYYKTNVDSKDELKNIQLETAQNIAEEGIVLLEKGNIPFDTQKN